VVIKPLTSDMLKKLDQIEEETELIQDSGREGKKLMLDKPVEQRRTQSQPPVVIPRLNLPKTKTDKEERDDKLKGKSNFIPH
jgi:hypothetical protein